MYLVVDPLTRFFIFTEQDPRADGYSGDVETDVRLEDLGTMQDRSQEATLAEPCVGRSPEDTRHYRVFESIKLCRSTGFEPVANMYGCYQSWREFEEV